MSLIQQLANIGAEYNRFISAKNSEMKQQAQARLLELLDLTIADPRFRLRLKELTRLREIVCDESRSEMLQAYFLPFVYVARK
ncbi:MAG: hypothetical protein HYW51_03215 [Candidatus Doudnabacteria bacterium]|nr:hypothetical protein [Candidatus Doudnabacteria bacterium]